MAVCELLLAENSAWVLLAELRDFYRVRRDGFQLALEEHFSDLADWHVPKSAVCR